MTSNAKLGANSPLSSSDDDLSSADAAPPLPWDEETSEQAAPAAHDPDAKALLNRYLATLRESRGKLGNTALHDLEAKLAELYRKDSPKDKLAPAQPQPDSDAADQQASAQPAAKSTNLTDRLKELSTYLDRDLTKLEQDGAVPETFSRRPFSGQTSRPFADPNRQSHKSINTPILDRAWFEDRFAVMRASIDDLASKVPEKRLDELGQQFDQLMEKLDLLETSRSQEAVETGLKKLASYLEENKHWTESHDNRIRDLEERLNQLSKLVAQSNAALTATAKGLEIVARGTGSALASKTADMVVERLAPKLPSKSDDDHINRLTGEVDKLSQQSRHFAAKTDERLKMLQNTLDDGLERIDEIGDRPDAGDTNEGWDRRIDAEDTGLSYHGKMAAARRAAQLSRSPEQRFPEDGEPVRHQIPYREFLPAEERTGSHTGLIVAAVILLLASAAMLYLNLRDRNDTNLVSNMKASHVITSHLPGDGRSPVRIMLNQQGHNAGLENAQIVKASNGSPLVLNIASTDERLTKAAISGDMDAQFSIAESYLSTPANETRLAAQERLSKAARWFRRSAENGHPPSQYRLATLYELGHGVKKNQSRAIVWYHQAAESGHVKAMHNLAVLTISRDQTDTAYITAAQWFTKAAERGLRDSQYNLGLLYEHGLGVTKNERDAFRWYEAAARQGDDVAARKRDALAAAKPELLTINSDGGSGPAGWSTVTTSLTMQASKDHLPQDRQERASDAVFEPRSNLKKPSNSGAPAEARFDQNVVRAQKLLRHLGYDTGAIDGIFGPRTMKAILEFQEKNGLSKTGTVSKKLLSSMEVATAS